VEVALTLQWIVRVDHQRLEQRHPHPFGSGIAE
jgi:hypothetical protein